MTTNVARISRLAILALTIGALPLGAIAQNGAPRLRGKQLLSRVVTIGASLTAGFGTWRPLATYVEPAIRVPHRKIVRHDDILFFRRPTTVGKREVDHCLKDDPTFVIAIDFLFWYGYGFLWSEDVPKARLARLEKGLAQLDRIRVPIVIGDFPDMRGAHPWMLHAVQIPSKETLKRLNARVRAWANDKPHVLVLPLAEWMARLRRDDWPVSAPNVAGRLHMKNAIQWDRLHPTRLGYIFMLEEALRAMTSHFELGEGSIVYDPIRVARTMGLIDDLVHGDG